MRKVFLTVLAISTVLFISACSSKEEKELLDFHNDAVDDLLPLYEDFDDGYEAVFSEFVLEEQINVLKTELLPVAEEIEGFFEEHDPVTDDARAYYELRHEASQYLIDYIHESLELMEEYDQGTLSEAEAEEQGMELEMTIIDGFQEKTKEVDDLWDELYDEYGFKEIKE